MNPTCGSGLTTLYESNHCWVKIQGIQNVELANICTWPQNFALHTVAIDTLYSYFLQTFKAMLRRLERRHDMHIRCTSQQSLAVTIQIPPIKVSFGCLGVGRLLGISLHLPATINYSLGLLNTNKIMPNTQARTPHPCKHTVTSKYMQMCLTEVKRSNYCCTQARHTSRHKRKTDFPTYRERGRQLTGPCPQPPSSCHRRACQPATVNNEQFRLLHKHKSSRHAQRCIIYLLQGYERRHVRLATGSRGKTKLPKYRCLPAS